MHQIKRLLCIKGSKYQSEETTHRTRENLCKLFIGKEPKIHKVLKKYTPKEKIIHLTNGKMN
jgi:hypothetical protein